MSGRNRGSASRSQAPAARSPCSACCSSAATPGAGDEGDFNNVPGILLSALVVAAGFALLTRFRNGPLATAGVVASATGIPPLMFFLTVDVDDLPPYSTEAILYVSTLAWFACWAVGPGKGRPFYLGAALVGFWLSVLQLVEQVFDAPFGIAEEVSADIGDTDVFDGAQQAAFDAPDPTTLGILSLLVGIGYLVIGRLLDKSGKHGTATPFAFTTPLALATGVVLLVEDLELAGTGLLTIVLGAALAFHGATVGRRFTTWVGCAAVALGAALFLGDMSDDPTVLGMLFIAAGIALVAGGYAVAAVLDEPDELEPGPSSFVRPERKVTAPAQPPAARPEAGRQPTAGQPPPGSWQPWGQPSSRRRLSRTPADGSLGRDRPVDGGHRAPRRQLASPSTPATPADGRQLATRIDPHGDPSRSQSPA